MAESGKILIVDDDELVLRSLEQLFMDDYILLLASSGEEALDLLIINKDIDAVILDIKMAKMDGFETANKIDEINHDIPIIFYTGYPGEFEEDKIDQEYKPFDYISKHERPIRLIRTVKNAVTLQKLKSNSKDFVRFAKKNYGLIGKSQQMQEVYRLIEQIAPTDNKVMILGPTGTGKELVARAIHKRSKRADRQLAVLNCNHKHTELIESELFGHVKGAFTGAIEDRVGLCEYADKGTLFLDEIGDLDITTQAKLLRVLETGEMQKLGSPKVKKIDIRVICATHCDLLKLISENKFREDLYYRLKGITIKIPALSARREDIPDLIKYFIESYCMKKGDGLKVFDPAAIDLMIEYDWPGNVRNPLDTVYSLIDLSLSSFISYKDVTDYLKHSTAKPDLQNNLSSQVDDFKRKLIIKKLNKHNNNISAAARDLSIDPGNLNRMIKKLNIEIV